MSSSHPPAISIVPNTRGGEISIAPSGPSRRGGCRAREGGGNEPGAPVSAHVLRSRTRNRSLPPRAQPAIHLTLPLPPPIGPIKRTSDARRFRWIREPRARIAITVYISNTPLPNPARRESGNSDPQRPARRGASLIVPPASLSAAARDLRASSSGLCKVFYFLSSRPV
jgi:hypothetical protein